MITRLPRLLPLIALALILTLAVAPDARAGDALIVTKTDDTNDGACDADCSLREAIIAANENPDPTTIVLSAETYAIGISGTAENEGEKGDFDITSEVTIDGDGGAELTSQGAISTVIDGDSRDTVIDVRSPNGSLVLRDAIVQNGDGNYLNGPYAGGISSAGPLSLDNVIVRNNEKGYYAAGIYSEGQLSIDDSIISGNVGEADAGGIYSDADAEITNSTISDNTSTYLSTSAGGIYSSGALAMTDVTISGNTALGAGSGGGLYSDTYAHTLTRVSFIENTATGDNSGGAWFNYAESNATDILVLANDAGYGAGGIYNAAFLILSRALLVDNTAGAAGVGGYWEEGDGVLTNVTISRNSAGPDNAAGGVYINGELDLINVTIADNNTSGNDSVPGLWVDENLVSRNTIVTANGQGACYVLPGAVLTSLGGNFEDEDDCFTAPNDHQNTPVDLEGLVDNGGFTLTHALATGSAAIDQGVGCPPPDVDQRNYPRPAGDACDSGAFEVGPPPTASPTATPQPDEKIWGDSDCSGQIGARDSQAILRNVLSQAVLSQTEPCPDLGHVLVEPPLARWGDWDCNGSIGARDNQALLRHILGQAPLSQTEPCPDIGTTVSIAG